MDAPSLAEVPLEAAPWQQLQPLLDACFPRPPRNVFERVVASTHRRQRLWIAAAEGGHLDNLAVAPQARGQGVGQALVQRLLSDTAATGPAMVSLTTRIPEFFAPLGFLSCGELADGSTAMLTLLPQHSSRIAH